MQLPDACNAPGSVGILGEPAQTDLATGFVHDVDGLVGHETVADVAVGKGGGGHDGVVTDDQVVVLFVAGLQATKDVGGGGHIRLLHVDRLEASFEGGITFDARSELVEGCGADGAQFASRKGWLEHVGRVHRAFATAGTDDHVELVNEEDHFAVALADLAQDRLDAFLELPAELRPSKQSREVKRQNLFVLQRLGNITAGDALGEALDDGGLADTRFPDQDRIVLGPPREDLHGAENLIVAPDHRIEFPILSHAGQVNGVLLEGSVRALLVLVVNRAFAPEFPEGTRGVLGVHAGGVEHVGAGSAFRQRGEEEVLDADELILLLV